MQQCKYYWTRPVYAARCIRKQCNEEESGCSEEFVPIGYFHRSPAAEREPSAREYIWGV
jgi:hypothetical protein